MNELVKEESKSLIKISYDNSGNQIVSARELYEKLGASERFSRWWERFSGYGFNENVDFTTVHSSTVVNNGATRNLIDYNITINMAKELCMLQRSDIGKQFRQYFIEVEKLWNTPEAIMSRALVLANSKLEKMKIETDELRAENKAQKKKLIEQAPKVEFYDTVTKSETTFDMAEVAKVLKIPKIGSVKLFEFLREHGVLSDNKANWNEPYQTFVNSGYFKIVEVESIDRYGNIHVNKKTVVFQKGVDFIMKLAKDNGLIKTHTIALF